MKKDS